MTHSETASEFRRSKVPLWEPLTSVVILILLMILGAWIFRKGKTYDAARYISVVSGSGQSVQTEPLLDGLPWLVPLSEMEIYSPETLYEKINGRAPVYLDFGFRELRCRTFAVETMPEAFVDVFVYIMGSPLDAFGIFSMENVGEGAAVDFVPDGVRGGLGCYFRWGDAYVQVNGSSEAPGVQQLVDLVARELVNQLPAKEQGLEAKEALSVKGIRPGTLTYISENAYGQETLQGVFEAEVERAGTSMRVFVMQAETPEAAVEAWEALRGFYQRFGRVVKTQDNAAGESVWFVGESFGQSAGVYRMGKLLGGSMDAGGVESAETLMNELTAKKRGEP